MFWYVPLLNRIEIVSTYTQIYIFRFWSSENSRRTNVWYCLEQETQQNTEARQGESDWSTAAVNGANERGG